MSWLSSAMDFLGSDSNAGWINVAGKVADTALNLYSNSQTQKANERAAENIAEANRQNAEAVQAANIAAQDRFEKLSSDAQPGVTYLKKLASSNPYDLTPGQEQTLEQQRRVSSNALARSGLRGSGRAVTAALRDVDSSMRNSFIDSNLSRTDGAAGQLAGMSNTTNSNAANYGVNAAQSATGNLANTAATQGSADIANAQLSGQGLADIGSTVSSLIKEGRKSRYYTDDTQKEAI